MFLRSRFNAVRAALLVALASAGAAMAQYPAKSINMIVSVPPAAATDVAARLLAERLAAKLAQPIVVENRPGASSLIADRMGAENGSGQKPI